MTSATKSPYAGYRFPGEIISHAVWLDFRFPLSLRMVEEMLAARGIDVSHETVRQWARKFGQAFANQIRRRLPCPGDKWHLDGVCLMIRGTKHWLWRAVDQDGVVLDVLVQSRRDKRAAKRLPQGGGEVAIRFDQVGGGNLLDHGDGARVSARRLTPGLAHDLALWRLAALMFSVCSYQSR